MPEAPYALLARWLALYDSGKSLSSLEPTEQSALISNLTSVIFPYLLDSARPFPLADLEPIQESPLRPADLDLTQSELLFFLSNWLRQAVSSSPRLRWIILRALVEFGGTLSADDFRKFDNEVICRVLWDA